MAYKIKSKKIPENYFRERELETIKQKYKGKPFPFKIAVKEGIRESSGAIEREHREGSFVQYKGELAVIHKVEKRGVWIMPYKKEGFLEPEKAKFVTEKEIEAGKLTSVFTSAPIIMSNMPFIL